VVSGDVLSGMRNEVDSQSEIVVFKELNGSVFRWLGT